MARNPKANHVDEPHKSQVFVYSLTIRVNDVGRLQRAAKSRAGVDGHDLAEWRVSRKGPGTDLAIVLDPGVSPPGCSIIDSQVEEI